MNWFLRLKLGQKLILSFVVCALLTTVVGVYSLLRVVQMGGMFEDAFGLRVVVVPREGE